MLPKNSLVCLKEENPGGGSFNSTSPVSPPTHTLPPFKTVTQVRIKATGKEKPLTSLTPASGANTNTLCISRPGKLYLKSATYKEGSQPDASQISSATQKVQLSQSEPAQEGPLAWQPSTLSLVTLKTEALSSLLWLSPATVTRLPSEQQGNGHDSED